jgi:hypothetical protein
METSSYRSNIKNKSVSGPDLIRECHEYLEVFVKFKGLWNFYNPVSEVMGEKAANFVNELIKIDCPEDIAKDLSILTLYDLAILIGMEIPRRVYHLPEFIQLTHINRRLRRHDCEGA